MCRRVEPKPSTRLKATQLNIFNRQLTVGLSHGSPVPQQGSSPIDMGYLASSRCRLINTLPLTTNPSCIVTGLGSVLGRPVMELWLIGALDCMHGQTGGAGEEDKHVVQLCVNNHCAADQSNH